MEKNNTILNISEKLKEDLDFWFRYNNVSREKVNLFYDFIISLDELIESTYLGSDVLFEKDAMKGHFTWCWNKTIDNFNKERIHFKESGYHFEYFWNLYYEAYYTVKVENEENRLHEYFYKIFDLIHVKNENELDILLTIYKLFEQNLKK